MTFADSIANQPTRTTNGMPARVSTADALVDLFFAIGASRGKNIIPQFTAAYVQDQNIALRIVAWARDIRGGAGERQIFRDILTHLETADPVGAVRLVKLVPSLGRYDDLFVFKNPVVQTVADQIWYDAIFTEKNGLAAKWSERKGPTAERLKKKFGFTPKFYRKTLVGLTNVVEQKMCAGAWDQINYSHVPSVAHSRYKKSFGRHGTTYAEFIQRLVKGDDPTVKVNASAIFPYDVLKGRCSIGYGSVEWTTDELAVIEAQWNALPNYIGDAKVLPMVDVSGSMTCVAGKKGSVTCLDVAASLGLYFADKNTGLFKDCMLTFSGSPQLVQLKGNINQKIDQMVKTDWAMDTNLNAAFNKILSTAVNGKVAPEDMPETLVILSDMAFNACVENSSNTALEMIRQKYTAAGYKMPGVIFWNLNAKDNVPVKFDELGTALVSGFSPAICSSVLSANMDDMTPEAILLKTVMQDRYAV